MIEHHHCPADCGDHPQPFELADNPVNGELRAKWLCGRCWHKHGEVSVMVLCTPQTCPQDAD
jgi:hypothetical protein